MSGWWAIWSPSRPQSGLFCRSCTNRQALTSGSARRRQRHWMVRTTGRPRHADLEARLLGPFEVRYRGQALTRWPSQRAASLLKFLLLHNGRPVRREVLMDAFWPSSSPKSARNNLNVTVYQLRQQFRAHNANRTHIVYNAGSYRIDPELCCRTDVDDYARSVARGHQAADRGDGPAAVRWYREAKRLYAGPLLEDDTSGDWYIETQRRLHFEHCAVLERLCALLLEAGEVAQAVTVGDELLEADPCRETGHQLLMRAYAELEQPQLIVQQFKRCEAALRRELSIDVSEATDGAVSDATRRPMIEMARWD